MENKSNYPKHTQDETVLDFIKKKLSFYPEYERLSDVSGDIAFDWGTEWANKKSSNAVKCVNDELIEMFKKIKKYDIRMWKEDIDKIEQLIKQAEQE